MSGDWPYWLREHKGTLLAFAAFVVMFTIYATNHPAGLNANVATTAANKGVLLAIVAMAQTLVVLTSGIDLSVGMVMVLANCLASSDRRRLAADDARWACSACCSSAALCGAINGAHRDLRTAAADRHDHRHRRGVLRRALALRPVPGGDVNASLADALTGQLPGGVPASLALLLALVVIVWLPFRRSAIGRAAYAVGSSEVAAYMSGVPIRRAKFVAYTLSGLLASVAGLFLTFITYSGEASAANGSTYTLYSIAAVVLGGVSLFGGSGSAIGAIFGALMFRTIGDLLFVFNVEPLWQPLFQGIVLLGGGLPRRGAAAAHPQPARPVWLRRALPRDAAARVRRRVSQRAPAHRPGHRVGVRLHRRSCCSSAASIRAASCRRSTCCSS